MQLNPETGEYTYEAKSTGAEAGIAMANKMGTMDGPLIGALEHVPGISQGIAWNAMRTSNTIRNGARVNRTAPGSVRSTISPRHITKLGSTEAAIGDVRTEHYTPFNVLGKAGNALGHRAAARELAKIKATGDTSKMFAWAQQNDLITSGDISAIKKGEKAQFAGGGVVGRITAASELGTYSKKLPGASLSHKKINNITKFVGKQEGGQHLLNAARTYNTTGNVFFAGGASRATGMPVPSQFQPFGFHDSQQMGHFMGAAGSRLSQAATGYVAGASGTMNAATKGVLEGAAKTSEGVVGRTYLTWYGKAQEHMALGGGKGLFSGGLKNASAANSGVKWGAAKFGAVNSAKFAGNFIPFVNVALWAMTAYDLTKGAAALMGGAVDTARDAFTSFKGSINKPVMGMGYKDNTVAATSRARGVMAIQNSRLNARSVLGNEAAGMAAHFG